MKRTIPRKNMDMPQPAWVMMVRVFRSELEISFGGVCKGVYKKKQNTLSCAFSLVISTVCVHYRGEILILRRRFKIRQLSIKSRYHKRSRTNKMAKNVRCEHLHVMFLPVVNVSHPLSVQLGRLPMIRDRSRNCRVHKWGTSQRLDYQASHKSVLSNIYNQFVLKLQKKTQFKPLIMFVPLNVPVMMLTYLHHPRNCNVEFLPVNKTAKLDSESAL